VAQGCDKIHTEAETSKSPILASTLCGQNEKTTTSTASLSGTYTNCQITITSTIAKPNGEYEGQKIEKKGEEVEKVGQKVENNNFVIEK
jgi:hypothetical protein